MKKAFIWVGLCLFNTNNAFAAIPPSKTIEIALQKPLIVAIIDTGADIDHPSLRSVIWTNPGEMGLDSNEQDKSKNNKDDDGNGYADDLHGWNFVLNKPHVQDENGHGTHIAGIINLQLAQSLAALQKSRPIRLMILKYYSDSASDSENIENTAKSINYAIENGAEIINYSGGGSTPSKAEFQALKKAEEQQILVIAAAGNNKTNTDVLNYFPASYSLKNIISVAATDQNGELVSFSNYGQESVDVAAPGQKIFSTLPHGQWGYMSGTSQATAFVTGVVARQLAGVKKTSYDSVLFSLLDHGHFHKSLVGKTKYQMALKN